MAAILEIPQYVAYQKNVFYALIKVSAKSNSFNICAQWMGLAALLNGKYIWRSLKKIFVATLRVQRVRTVFQETDRVCHV